MYTTIHHIGLVPYHKYQDIDVVPTTCARTCSLTSLARKRTAFYAYSERQHEPYAKMTALSPFYRSTAHPLHQSNPKASGPDNVQPHTSRP